MQAPDSTVADQATAAADNNHFVPVLGNIAAAGPARGREAGHDSNHPFSAPRAVEPVLRGKIAPARDSAPAGVE